MEEKEFTIKQLQTIVDCVSEYKENPTVCKGCGREFYVFFTDKPPKHFERCTQHIIILLPINTN